MSDDNSTTPTPNERIPEEGYDRFRPVPIPLKDAVTLIARTVYPEEVRTQDGKRQAENRIRQAIRDADLPTMAGMKDAADMWDAYRLFVWAVTRWPTLARLRGCPQGVALGGTGYATVSADITVTEIPKIADPERLEQAYIAERVENQRLRARLDELEYELQKSREAKAKLTFSISEQCRGKRKEK